MAASPGSREQGYFSPARVQHVIIPEPLNKDRICLGHRGVWWAEIETHGRIAHGSMPFLGDSAIRHMGAVLAEMEDELYPALDAKHTAMPVVPPRRPASTHQHQFDPWRPAGAETATPAFRRRWCRIRRASSSTGAT